MASKKRKKKQGMNSENKRLLIIGGVILGVILLIVLIALIGNDGEKKGLINTDITLYQEVLKNEEATIIYVSAASCSYCQQFNPVIKDVAKEYGLEVYKLDLDAYSDDDKAILYNSLEFFSTEWGTPTTLVVKGGEVVGTFGGAQSEENLIKFFKEQGFIEKTEADIEYLTNVDVAGYLEAIKSSEPIIMYVASASCVNCQKATPHLEEIVQEENIKIYHIDLDEIASQEESDSFVGSFDIYAEEDFGTPTTLVVKDSQIIASLEGYQSKEKFLTFFKDNGFIQ